MIYTFKLISGEEIIGALDCKDDISINELEYCNIVNPMHLIDGFDQYGNVTMKLRDTMLLSDETMMTVPSKYIITYYPVTKIMEEYYKRAVIFAKEHTKKKIEKQIKDSTEELKEYMSETNIEKILRELRFRNINPGNDTVN